MMLYNVPVVYGKASIKAINDLKEIASKLEEGYLVFNQAEVSQEIAEVLQSVTTAQQFPDLKARERSEERAVILELLIAIYAYFYGTKMQALSHAVYEMAKEFWDKPLNFNRCLSLRTAYTTPYRAVS